MPEATIIPRADTPRQGPHTAALQTVPRSRSRYLPFWTLSAVFHVAGLLAAVALAPLLAEDAGGGAGVSLVLRAEAMCVGPESDEEVLDLECVEATPPLTTALWMPETRAVENDRELDDPFDDLLDELPASQQSEPPFFIVPLEAARRRPPRTAPAVAPMGPPPTPHSQRAAPKRKPAPTKPAVTSPRAAATTASAPSVPSTSASRRPVRRGQGAGGQRSLRIRYAPRVLDYYPRVARRRGHEGTVVVLMVIDAHGAVVRASLIQSSGHTSLDEAALRIARAYRFVPPGVERRARLPIAFSLHRG